MWFWFCFLKSPCILPIKFRTFLHICLWLHRTVTSPTYRGRHWQNYVIQTLSCISSLLVQATAMPAFLKKTCFQQEIVLGELSAMAWSARHPASDRNVSAFLPRFCFIDPCLQKLFIFTYKIREMFKKQKILHLTAKAMTTDPGHDSDLDSLWSTTVLHLTCSKLILCWWFTIL